MVVSDFLKSLEAFENKYGELSKLGKALYLYNEICKYFSYKIDIYFMKKNEIEAMDGSDIEMGTKIIEDETICTWLSELFIRLLREALNLTEEEAYLGGDEHKFALFEIDGERFSADPIYDLLNAKISSRFGFFCNYSEKKGAKFPELKTTRILSSDEMDKLYNEIRYATVTSLDTMEDRKIYYEDVIDRICSEMSDSNSFIKLIREIFEDEDVDFDNMDEFEKKSKLNYYKIKFVFKFLSESLKFSEDEMFYRMLFKRLFPDDRERSSNIKYVSFNDAKGNKGYIFEMTEAYGDKHYFRKIFRDGKSEIEELTEEDIRNDRSIVVVFDSSRIYGDIEVRDLGDYFKTF